MKKCKESSIKASDYKCCICKKTNAVAFWPCIDPDIPSHPYCRKCLDRSTIELLMKLIELDDGEALKKQTKTKKIRE